MSSPILIALVGLISAALMALTGTAEAYSAAQLEQTVGMPSSVLVNLRLHLFGFRNIDATTQEYRYKNLVDDPAIEWTAVVVVNDNIARVSFVARQPVIVPPVRIQDWARVPTSSEKVSPCQQAEIAKARAEAERNSDPIGKAAAAARTASERLPTIADGSRLSASEVAKARSAGPPPGYSAIDVANAKRSPGIYALKPGQLADDEAAGVLGAPFKECKVTRDTRVVVTAQSSGNTGWVAVTVVEGPSQGMPRPNNS